MGAGALENTSMALKSVWVVSVEVGPRSVVAGGEEGESGVGVVERVRAWLRALVVGGGCGEWRLGRGGCDEKFLGRCGACWRRGRVDRIVSVALSARRRGTLGAAMVVTGRSRMAPLCVCVWGLKI